MEPLTFESRDLGQAEEFLSRAYASMSIGSDVDRPHTRVSRRVAGAVSVDHVEFDFHMSYAVDPLGKVCLCVVESGRIDQRVEGEEEDVFRPGDAVLITPPDRPYNGLISRAGFTIIMFDTDLLQQVAGVLPGRPPEPVQVFGHRPVSAAAARHLYRTLTYVRDDVLSDPGLAAEPLVAAGAGQLLAATVLATLPSNAALPGDEVAADRRDAHTQTLRRAVAFIDEHADAPLGIAEIAAAARVSPRALQYAFRRHLNTTPLGYLRRVRMARAHDELRAGDPATLTVTSVAARWGFFHPGRFAASYRAVYGRTPSETLHGLRSVDVRSLGASPDVLTVPRTGTTVDGKETTSTTEP
ncbi:AraC family transcriptional regulator [Nonomuraea sp. NPDC049421]|uniref:helix-turn-helix transcriptional regulator n=1 Tax=Nonomuraea sp. NPDC049421 TaxID=3155275 RepID=UPI00342E54EB